VHEGFACGNSFQRSEGLKFKKFRIRERLKVRTEVRVSLSLNERNVLHKQMIAENIGGPSFRMAQPDFERRAMSLMQLDHPRSDAKSLV
jgi:hypothetical protein